MKRIFALLVAISLICPTVVMAATDSGLAFGNKDLYLSESPISGFPVTVEATIKFPSGYTARGGAVIGNYTASGVSCFNLEIYNNGVPRFFWIGKSKKQVDLQFSNVNVCTGKWVHIAIVTDNANSKAYCYVDGVLKQTISNISYPTLANITAKLAVGGDQRSGNAQYFKGNVKSLRLYSDMRTPEEIASDYNGTTLDTSDLLLAYDMQPNSDGSRPTMLQDLSGNGNHVYHNSHYWTDEVEPLESYEYSMAVIGDTGVLSKSYPKEYNVLYDWLLDNADEKNIKFVFGLGDITSNGYAEYALADANFMNLNERIPYSFVRGDKDTVARFNEIFPLDRYDDQIGGSFDGTMLNTYRKFDAGQLKYLALSLDVGASDEVIAWANEICEANPDRNVIVSTHAYLDDNGNTLSNASSLGANVGTNLWNKLIKLHKNIIMVLCGHADTRKNIVLSTKTGVNNNVVTQILVNPTNLDSLSAGAGMVAMLYFSQDGKNVQIRYYSTVQNAYFSNDNQFSFDVNAVEPISDSDMSVKFTYTVNTDDGVVLPDGNLAMDVELEEEKGKVFVVVYNNNGELTRINAYDAKKSFTVNMDSVSSGDKVKIMWWSSGSGLIPYSSDKWVCTYIVQ